MNISLKVNVHLLCLIALGVVSLLSLPSCSNDEPIVGKDSAIVITTPQRNTTKIVVQSQGSRNVVGRSFVGTDEYWNFGTGPDSWSMGIHFAIYDDNKTFLFSSEEGQRADGNYDYEDLDRMNYATALNLYDLQEGQKYYYVLWADAFGFDHNGNQLCPSVGSNPFDYDFKNFIIRDAFNFGEPCYYNFETQAHGLGECAIASGEFVVGEQEVVYAYLKAACIFYAGAGPGQGIGDLFDGWWFPNFYNYGGGELEVIPSAIYFGEFDGEAYVGEYEPHTCAERTDKFYYSDYLRGKMDDMFNLTEGPLFDWQGEWVPYFFGTMFAPTVDDQEHWEDYAYFYDATNDVKGNHISLGSQGCVIQGDTYGEIDFAGCGVTVNGYMGFRAGVFFHHWYK